MHANNWAITYVDEEQSVLGYRHVKYKRKKRNDTINQINKCFLS